MSAANNTPSGAGLHTLLDDPAGQAAFMLPRLDEAQRNLIVSLKPTTASQRVSRRAFDAVWPGVKTGQEWPDQFWFAGGCAHYPAGRPPIGNKRSSYSFHLNEAGLLVREMLLTRASGQRK